MPIVTDGLIGYWHYQQGVQGSTWNNIAPATKGQYNGTIAGAVLQADGMYFDGIDDSVDFPNLGIVGKSFTLETRGYYSGSNGFLVLAGATHRIGFLAASNIVQSLFNGGGFCNSPTSSVMSGNWYTLTYRYDYSLRREELFINGTTIATRTNATTTNLNVAFNMGRTSGYDNRYSGHIPFLRVYDKALTNQQITQNYAVGTAIGLGDDPPPVETPPSVSIVSQSRSKLSPIPPMDKSTLKFKFDQNVTDWAVMVLGSDYSTGTIAGSGKNVAKDTEIAVDITHQMLYQEGDNRINIYGRNSDGQWTPYD